MLNVSGAIARTPSWCGIDEQRAYEHFDEWSAEDTYFSLDDELTAMREAKFHAECIWRDRPNTLLVGRKK